MRKLMSTALAAAMLLLLSACAAGKTAQPAGDYPAAIMVDGAVYQMAYQTVENVDDAAVLGHTTSYTDAWPEKDGETNFSRALDLPYARCEEGIAAVSYTHLTLPTILLV